MKVNPPENPCGAFLPFHLRADANDTPLHRPRRLLIRGRAEIRPPDGEHRVRVQHVEHLELGLHARPAEGEYLGPPEIQLVQPVEELGAVGTERDGQRRLLNCVNEPELEHLSKDFAKLLYPAGKLVMVVMGKYCLWETLYFFAKFKFTKALRRWDNKGVHTKIEDEEFETWFYSVRSLNKIFSPHFKLIDVKPIAVVVPPSYLQNYFDKKPKLLKKLDRIDQLLTRFKWLSNFSDHLILTFELKKPVE